VSVDLSGLRALLFLPASNPRAIARARASAADLVILDLEDAVKDEDKDTARTAAVAALADPWPMPVAIRVNALGTRWFAQDVAALARSKADLAVAPMVTDPSQVNVIRENSARPVIAMIESAAGVLAAPDIARVSAARSLTPRTRAMSGAAVPGGQRSRRRPAAPRRIRPRADDGRAPVGHPCRPRCEDRGV
jgi:citrate lyase beta subunit